MVGSKCHGTISAPTELHTVQSKLSYVGLSISKIKELGKFNFLVTFASKEDMQETLSMGKDFLASVFDDI